MNTKAADFRKRLLSTFKVEAQDHLKNISSGMIELEKIPPADRQAGIIENIFRGTHSLKGAARAVNMQDVERICQSLESVFSVWKDRGVPPNTGLFDAIYKAIEGIRVSIDSIEDETFKIDSIYISDLINELSSIEQESASGNTGAGAAGKRRAVDFIPPQQTTDTVRISTSKLLSLLLEAEEMVSTKLAANQITANLKDTALMVRKLKKGWTGSRFEIRGTGVGKPEVETDSDCKNKLQDLFDRALYDLKSIEDRIAALTKQSTRFNRSLDRMVDNLLDDMKHAMMLPFSSILESFPFIVRDISHEQGKEVALAIRGDAIEVDRRILEEIKDPLIHMVRNCVDHGIERPGVRERNGKPRQGTITISISQVDGNKIEVILSDDGAGIDIEEVKERAVKNGLLSRSDADGQSDRESLSLIFHSGISTSPIITDISGRGIGLAIVREKIEKLGGVMSAETGAAGTTFRMVLPLTVATFRGVLVRAADQILILPTLNIERVTRIRDSDITTVENRDTVSLRGRTLSFVRLNAVLGLPADKDKKEGAEFTTVLVISIGEKRIAFGVDEMLDEQEVLVKPLCKQLSRVRNIAGTAVLGSGKPVPILNVQDLMKSAVKTVSAPLVQPGKKEETEKKSILVAEDSITSRILLKNILESAGYIAKTAVDGVDAITTLKTEKFDLVVSDVEMPRMDGFDLTARIRSDAKLAELPVVLVTALESREDRERGISVGANAYIIKSSFNQGNLLEVIKRLI